MLLTFFVGNIQNIGNIGSLTHVGGRIFDQQFITYIISPPPRQPTPFGRPAKLILLCHQGSQDSQVDGGEYEPRGPISWEPQELA